jgi:hypothetical protein
MSPRVEAFALSYRDPANGQWFFIPTVPPARRWRGPFPRKEAMRQEAQKALGVSVTITETKCRPGQLDRKPAADCFTLRVPSRSDKARPVTGADNRVKHAPVSEAKIGIEPGFISQSSKQFDEPARLDWFRTCARSAAEKGATFHRFSIHPDIPNLILHEGWKARPDDQGPQRWRLPVELACGSS